MRKADKWIEFSDKVYGHIQEYVVPQYGEDGEDPATEYTLDDCVKQAQRYLARHGKSSRQGEEARDLFKAAHWIQMAHDRLPKGTGDAKG